MALPGMGYPLPSNPLGSHCSLDADEKPIPESRFACPGDVRPQEVLLECTAFTVRDIERK
jgi:hypothetical protein